MITIACLVRSRVPVMRKFLLRQFLPAVFCLGLLGGCTTNPATGQSQFTGFVTPQQEEQMGYAEHPKVLAQFGGEYRPGGPVGAYVTQVGNAMVPFTERKDVRYKFYLLDSEVPNAFALPGGYVYITRGLMALMNNEAQLAGVLGHEIGHVTGRHSAEQMSKATLAQLGLAVGGTLVDSPYFDQAAGLGAELFLKKWSRGHEHQADELGVRYMSRAGYNPFELAQFLQTLNTQEQLESRVSGNAPNPYHFLSTHPLTGDRIVSVSNMASGAPASAKTVNRDRFLRTVDGMVYGSSPEQGYIRDRAFIHVPLGFRFEVPDGFRLINTNERVMAVGPQNAGIVFDAAPTNGVTDPVTYLTRIWTGKARPRGVERLKINGLDAATGTLSSGGQDLRLLVVRWPDNKVYYRFIFMSPRSLTAQLNVPYRETTYSFRQLTGREKQTIRPRRIKLHTVRSGETVSALAQKLPFEKQYREDYFRMLNAMSPRQQLQAGQVVKLVVE